MNEGQSENLFCLECTGDGAVDGVFIFFFAARSLNKEDENSCTELIGNWKYFGICYFFHLLLCSTEIRDICKTKLKCKF